MTNNDFNSLPVIAWWSGGITSAVACKLAIEKYQNVKLIYIHISSHHVDTIRFKRDCERWYGQKIEPYSSLKYDNQFDVILDTKFINGPNGARCTTELKKEVRKLIERNIPFKNQVWGFEFVLTQVNRAIRWQEQYPHTKPLFPLIEEKLTKNECAGIITSAGIKLPEMYLLGYNNNNCIGCVKGGAGYWNKIRVDFPDVFDQMAKAEREVDGSCLKTKNGRLFLDELDPKAGRPSEVVLPECGIFCQVQFADIISPKAEAIIKGESSIYDN